MKRPSILFIFAALALPAFSLPTPGDIVEEPIGPLTLVPNQPIDLIFPNEVDSLHQKHVYFDGHAAAVGAPQATLTVTFDYHLDPADPPQDPAIFSPSFDIPISDTGTPIFVEWWIPVCPPWVSIHFEGNEFMVVEGVFVHQCVSNTVPDTGLSALEASLVILGLLAAGRRCEFGAQRRSRANR